MPDMSDAEAPTRERILRAATTLMAESGFAGLRTDKVAFLAECNKQMIYYYFKNKAGLRSAVLEHMADIATPDWTQLRGMSVPAAVDARTHVREASSSGNTYPRLLAWEGAEHKSGSSEIVLEERRTEAWRHWVEVFERAQAAGELAPDVDPKVLALMFQLMSLAPETLPQITRMITGYNPDDPTFRKLLAETLRFVAQSVSTPRRD